MRIEICIPAYNEERIIAESARAVLRALRDAGKKDALVTVCDNASFDATARIAKGVIGVGVLSVPVRGKGAAVVGAARHSQADIFGFIDADISADPSEIATLVAFIENDDCDIVVGSRLLNTEIIRRGVFRSVLSRAFNILRKMILGIRVQDTQCGLKVMNVHGRDVLATCVETGWFFDIEFLARAERAGLRIREVPIRWDEERFPGRVSKLNHVRDSIGALRAMVRIRRALRDSQPTSH